MHMWIFYSSLGLLWCLDQNWCFCSYAWSPRLAAGREQQGGEVASSSGIGRREIAPSCWFPFFALNGERPRASWCSKSPWGSKWDLRIVEMSWQVFAVTPLLSLTACPQWGATEVMFYTNPASAWAGSPWSPGNQLSGVPPSAQVFLHSHTSGYWMAQVSVWDSSRAVLRHAAYTAGQSLAHSLTLDTCTGWD